MIRERSHTPYLFFIFSILSYAIFSFPFPKNPGVIEMIIGVLLIKATGINGVLGLFSFGSKENDLQKIRLAFWFLLFIPTITMLVNGWELNDYVRDIIPLVYMFLPLLVFSNLKKSKYILKLPFILSVVGLIFSIRFFIETESTPLDVGGSVLWDNKKYFSYDPAVLFGAIWFFIRAGEVFSRKITNTLLSICYFLGSFICLTALAAVVQRAPLALFAVACCIYFVKSNIPRIYKVVIIFLLFIVSFEYLGELILNVLDMFYEKQIVHGLNNKDSEFSAVFEVMSLGISTSLFGVGWGGIFYNPAYGMLMSNTHSIISYALIKTGLLGMGAFAIYGSRIIRDILSIYKYDLGVTLASSFSLVIGLLFQPTYKTLSYGVILVIIVSHSYFINDKKG